MVEAKMKSPSVCFWWPLAASVEHTRISFTNLLEPVCEKHINVFPCFSTACGQNLAPTPNPEINPREHTPEMPLWSATNNPEENIYDIGVLADELDKLALRLLPVAFIQTVNNNDQRSLGCQGALFLQNFERCEDELLEL